MGGGYYLGFTRCIICNCHYKTPGITYDKPSRFIGGLSIDCITISSIILAAIYAIITIIGARSPEKVKSTCRFQ